MGEDLNQVAKRCFYIAKNNGFYDVDFPPSHRLMEAVTELGEAMEAGRKGDHHAYAGEIIDAIIILLGHLYHQGVDVGWSMGRKMDLNEGRGHLHGKSYWEDF